MIYINIDLKAETTTEMTTVETRTVTTTTTAEGKSFKIFGRKKSNFLRKNYGFYKMCPLNLTLDYRKGYEVYCHEHVGAFSLLSRSDAEIACDLSNECVGIYDQSDWCKGRADYRNTHEICKTWKPLHEPHNGIDNSAFRYGCTYYKGTK